MIPKSRKFPLRTEFLRFRAKAKPAMTPHLRIMTLSHSPSRLSVIIPKKVSKYATTRNYLKRLTYNYVWPLLKENNLDCVIIYKPLPFKKSIAAAQTILLELKSLSSLT